MQEMTLYGFSFEPIGKQPIVLLKTTDDDKFLPIWIGHPEAAEKLTGFPAKVKDGELRIGFEDETQLAELTEALEAAAAG